MARARKCAVIVLGTALLTACQTPLPPPATAPVTIPCPAAILPPATASLRQGATLGAITGVSTVCGRYASNLSVDLDIAFTALRPKGGPAENVSYPYRVTIVQPGDVVRSQEVYHARLNFADGATNAGQHDHLHQIIPITFTDGIPDHIVIDFNPPPATASP